MYKYIYDQKDKKVGIIIVVFLISLLLLYSLIYLPRRKNNLIKHGKYTIGTISKIIECKGTNDPEYIYEVKGFKYFSTEARIIQGTYNFTNDLIGKRYYVLFDSTSPSKSCLLPLEPVPDSVESAPSFGWDKIR